MLKITCSSLEDVKKNPELTAQMLIENSSKNRGGRGMMSDWQDVAKAMLRKDIPVSKALETLEEKLQGFADNKKNNQRRELLQQQLLNFKNNCTNKGFKFEDSPHRINWELYAGVSLTGLTPIVMHDNNEFYSFIFSEHPLAWNYQLRFPLFQQYLADYTLHCQPDELNVGIYCLEDDKFSFKKFTDVELNAAVNKTSTLFETVQKFYTNLKAKANVLR